MAFLIDAEIRERVRQIELPWNRFGVDPFGVSQRELARFYTVLSWLYKNYFRVSTTGIGNVPPSGRVMLVGNHSGGVAIDGAMVIASLFLEMDPPRLAQGMVEKFINRLPIASSFTNRTGQLTGLPEHAMGLLEAERVLMVFPEGARGTAKLYGDRNTLVRFGTGFMRLALETNTPIVPLAFIGGGDAVPTIMNLYKVGKLLGLPYLPVTPYLLPIPRPVACQIYFGEPMKFEGTGREEDSVIMGQVEEVRTRVGELIEAGARIRKGHREAVRG